MRWATITKAREDTKAQARVAKMRADSTKLITSRVKRNLKELKKEAEEEITQLKDSNKSFNKNWEMTEKLHSQIDLGQVIPMTQAAVEEVSSEEEEEE
ncbi:hypothetical protein COCNU_scaffold000320G000040 [Cocos nucifera]|nr:hypothetical protein [Cocos nucifera]